MRFKYIYIIFGFSFLLLIFYGSYQQLLFFSKLDFINYNSLDLIQILQGDLDDFDSGMKTEFFVESIKYLSDYKEILDQNNLKMNIISYTNITIGCLLLLFLIKNIFFEKRIVFFFKREKEILIYKRSFVLGIICFISGIILIFNPYYFDFQKKIKSIIAIDYDTAIYIESIANLKNTIKICNELFTITLTSLSVLLIVIGLILLILNDALSKNKNL